MRRAILLLASTLLAPAVATAGAWTQPEGRLWLKVSGIAQESDEFYAASRATLADGTDIQPGDARPYDNNGVGRSYLVWSELEYGVTDRLTLGVQVPYYDLRYEDDLAIHNSHGIGDIRLAARQAILTGLHRVSARVVWKLPTGNASDDPSIIPLGDGQSDLEIGLQLGRSLGRPLSWLGAEAGYRLRARDEDRDWDPGDEWFWLLEAGYGVYGDGQVGLKASYTGTRGDETSLNFFASAVDLSRDFDRVDLVVMVDVRHAFLELGWGKTLGSETYPVSGIWSLGISRALDVR